MHSYHKLHRYYRGLPFSKINTYFDQKFSIQFKIKAVMGLVHSAAVPWSAEMACLVHSSLRLDHPEIEELRKECELAELKVVLHKYNIHQLPKCIEISQMKVS